MGGGYSTASLPTERHGFRSAMNSQPAFEVGGDFFAVVARERGRMTVLIGDACGRGTRASSIVAWLSPMVRRALRTIDRPRAILAELNRAAWSGLSDETFVTAACLSLEAVNGRMLVANAGHVPPVVRRAWGVAMFVGNASGPPLGMLRDACYVEHEIDLNIGDVVVLMTDGVLEAVEDDMLSMGKLTKLVALAPPSAQEINQLLTGETARRSCDGQRDDFMLLSFERIRTSRARRVPRVSRCAS
jgi:phosphoserine phosphatase RsbU/P